MAIGDEFFQVVSDDDDVIANVRIEVASEIVDGPALPGFKVNPPTPETKLWLLVGSHGGVLARSNSAGPVVRSLHRHLEAMRRPKPAGATRLRVGAVAGDRSVTLIDPKLLIAQPPVERRFTRAQLQLVDSPFIELQRTDNRWFCSADEPAGSADDGHVALGRAVGPVSHLVWAGQPGANDPTTAQVAHALAPHLLGGDVRERLSVAEELAQAIEVVLINQHEPSSVTRTLIDLNS